MLSITWVHHLLLKSFPILYLSPRFSDGYLPMGSFLITWFCFSLIAFMIIERTYYNGLPFLISYPFSMPLQSSMARARKGRSSHKWLFQKHDLKIQNPSLLLTSAHFRPISVVKRKQPRIPKRVSAKCLFVTTHSPLRRWASRCLSAGAFCLLSFVRTSFIYWKVNVTMPDTFFLIQHVRAN